MTSTAHTQPTLVTGAAGFIGFHTACALLRRGTPVIGFDNVNDYYDPATSSAPVQLTKYVEAIEKALGKKAIIELKPLQPDDVPDTYADTTELQQAVGYKPATPVEQGVQAFVDWYRHYYSNRID